MIDHVSIELCDLDVASRFHGVALAPPGLR